MDKKSIRKDLSKLKSTLSGEYLLSASDKISDLFINSGLSDNARNVFVYLSVPGEPDTKKIINYLLENNKKVYVPYCREKGLMDAYRFLSYDNLILNKFLIPEPLPTADILLPSDADICIIPCLSCTKSGKRLGHGGGYYDRYLSKVKCTKVCLCFEKLISSDLLTDEYDVSMDYVITEESVY